MATDKERITAYLSSDAKKLLEALAKKEDRSISYMVSKMVEAQLSTALTPEEMKKILSE